MKVIYNKAQVVGIPIEVLMKKRAVPFAVYIKINNKKFVLVSNENEPTPQNVIEKYKSRGAKNLYIKVEDKDRILYGVVKVNSILQKIKDLKPLDSKSNTTEFKARAEILKDGTKDVLKELYTHGLDKVTPELVEASTKITESLVDLISKDVNIVEDFLILIDSADYFWSRAVASAAFMSAFLQYLGKESHLEGIASSDNVRDASLAALLHDIGNKFIEPKILLKTERLSRDEFKEIRKHPNYSYKLVERVEGMNKLIGETILQHHEHHNGSGYPNGLKGSQINVYARILTIIDCFTAMIMDRPYAEKYSVEKALEIMFAEDGKFDEMLLMKFFEMFKNKLSFKKL